jgi:hypothetical protein
VYGASQTTGPVWYMLRAPGDALPRTPTTSRDSCVRSDDPRDGATETPHWRSPRLLPTCSRRSGTMLQYCTGPSVQNLTDGGGPPEGEVSRCAANLVNIVGHAPKQFSAIEPQIGINAVVNQVLARCGARTLVAVQSRNLRPPASAGGPVLSDFRAMAMATDYCVSGGFRSTTPSDAVPLTDSASSNRLGLSALAASVSPK